MEIAQSGLNQRRLSVRKDWRFGWAPSVKPISAPWSEKTRRWALVVDRTRPSNPAGTRVWRPAATGRTRCRVAIRARKIEPSGGNSRHNERRAWRDGMKQRRPSELGRGASKHSHFAQKTFPIRKGARRLVPRPGDGARETAKLHRGVRLSTPEYESVGSQEKRA